MIHYTVEYTKIFHSGQRSLLIKETDLESEIMLMSIIDIIITQMKTATNQLPIYIFVYIEASWWKPWNLDMLLFKCLFIGSWIVFRSIFQYFWRPYQLAYILLVASSEFLSFLIHIWIILYLHGDIFFKRLKREERQR